jgi:hypothetical protein
VEGRVRLEHGVGGLERGRERVRFDVGPVARRVEVREVEHRTYPARAPRDLDHVVQRAQVAHTPHHLDAEGNGASLSLESLAQAGELLDDRIERSLARALEQEAGMEHDRGRSARSGDAGAAVERANGRCELPARRLHVAHEAEQRRVHGQRDVVLACQLAEPLGPRVVHPEAGLEIDLARVVAALDERFDRRLGALPRRHPCRAEP